MTTTYTEEFSFNDRSVNLTCIVKRESASRYVAGCSQLDVYSQARSENEARESLKEAIALWFEDCFRRGKLDSALQEVGL